jgi:ADP-heptose:LPS heptosyltransferase
MNKTLLIALQGIGNTAMALHAAEKLTKQPFSNLSMVVSNNGSHELAGSMLPKNRVYIWDEKKGAAENVTSIAHSTRQDVFDEVYMAYPSGRREGVIGLLSRAKVKKALCDNDKDLFLFRKIYKSRKLKPSHIHDISANLFLFGRPYQDYIRPVFITDSIKKTCGDFAEHFFDENNLSHNFTIALHPGCKSPGKRWPVENYIKLCRIIDDKMECKFLIIGGREEGFLKKQVASEIGKNAAISDTASVIQLAALLGKCQLFIGNDSAPMHLATLMATPVTALWGYSDFYRTSPYGPGNVLLRMNYFCSPCYKFSGRYVESCRNQLSCIRNIPFEPVAKVIIKYIDILKEKSRNITLDDINSLYTPNIAKIFSLDHGCIVINFS